MQRGRRGDQSHAGADVSRSSGVAAFDQEALQTLGRAQPFPPPAPGELSGDSIEFEIPVRFALH
jgi:TonB family protein